MEGRRETARERLDRYYRESSPDYLLGKRQRPPGWTKMTREDKLDYVATRILAEDRYGITSRTIIKSSGILSASQWVRRKQREVSSAYGVLNDYPPIGKVFSRSVAHRTRPYWLRTRKKPDESKSS